MAWELKAKLEDLRTLDWKQLLKLEQYEVLGLDIGSSAVKIVQLHKNDTSYTVTAAGIVDIANENEHNDSNGETKTITTIQKCLESTGIQTQFVVCSVCGPEVAVRPFKFPSLPLEEIEGAILLEAGQVCPFNVDDASVDYQLISDGEDNVSGVLVAATNKLINRKSQLAKDATLNNVLMDVDGLALLNCFNNCSSFGKLQNGGSPSEREQSEAGRPVAILNVGSSFTNLAIMGDNSLPFIRDMAYAGDDIVKQIATENNVSTETVGKILSGRENSGQPQLELGDSLVEACQKLIVDVTETLRYYAAQEKSAVVKKVFVCGGFALVKGFVELLDNQLPAKAVLWNPFDKMCCDASQPCEEILRKSGPAMAVAAGLAMRSI